MSARRRAESAGQADRGAIIGTACGDGLKWELHKRWVYEAVGAAISHDLIVWEKLVMKRCRVGRADDIVSSDLADYSIGNRKENKNQENKKVIVLEDAISSNYRGGVFNKARYRYSSFVLVKDSIAKI